MRTQTLNVISWLHCIQVVVANNKCERRHRRKRIGNRKHRDLDGYGDVDADADGNRYSNASQKICSFVLSNRP